MPSKNLQLTVVWIVLASLLTVAAYWQAQSAVTRDALARHQSLPPPVKTRHAVRPVAQPWSGDVVADYAARCEKGMTDQEIGWIVEDFENAGLAKADFSDETLDDDFLSYRALQQDWYRRTLNNGIRLSPEQIARVKTKLRDLLQATATRYIQDRAEEKAGKFVSPVDTSAEVVLAHVWIFDESANKSGKRPFLPWELCELTAQQKEIVREKMFLTSIENSSGESDPSHSTKSESEQEHAGASKLPFLSDVLLPDSQIVPEQFGIAGALFPFLKSQKFTIEDSDASLLANVRRLHPAQFKMLLLFFPYMAADIKAQLSSQPR